MASSVTLLKIILVSSLVIGGPGIDEEVDESEAVDTVRVDEPDEGGVAGFVWKGAGWPCEGQ